MTTLQIIAGVAVLGMLAWSIYQLGWGGGKAEHGRRPGSSLW